jgi:5-formyltetrahydrofolate cyclo-ligase
MHPTSDRSATSTTQQEQKAVLRRTMRTARNALSETARDQASSAICRRLLSLPALKESSSVAVYLATRHEANVDAIASTLIRCGTTVVAPMGESQFGVLRNLHTDVVTSERGLREPVLRANTVNFAPDELDVILVPGLAFSRSGTRLGQGGGWYDRVLAMAPHAMPVGICFDCQLVPHIPSEPHDRRVALVVTETQIVEVDKK